jgi:hypothetical protein
MAHEKADKLEREIHKDYLTRKERLALWSVHKVLNFLERIDHLWPHD